MGRDLVASEYHGHEIVSWAVEETCFFCRYPASHKVTEDGVYDTHPYTAYVCCDHFWAPCKNSDAPSCRKCKHPWHKHERETPYGPECVTPMGMGDWCGCREKKPHPIMG